MSLDDLNSDELGEKGEARFKEICADAKLVCNKSDRDRFGWDFSVDFPHDSSEPFDSRPRALSTYFQVKTIKSTTLSAVLRLSSAEHLAKEPKPSFVYVMTVNDDLSYGPSFILHFLDEPLSRLLKRLREESIGVDRPALNKQTISFALSNMAQLLPTGRALAAHVRHLCPDFPQYVTEKSRQLKELGFEPGRYRASVTFKASTEDLVDGFLGLKPLEVMEFRPSEFRFGIERQLIDFGITKGIMQIAPLPKDYCTITVRETKLATPIFFRAGMYSTPPGLPLKVILRHKLFEFTASKSGSGFSFNGDVIKAARCNLSDWIDLLRLQVMMMSNKGNLSIKPDRSKGFEMPMIIRDVIDPEPYQHALSICERALKIFGTAGCVDRLVSFDDVMRDYQIIGVIHSFLRDGWPADSVSFKIEKNKAKDVSSTASALLLNRIKIAGSHFAYCALLSVSSEEEDDLTVWKSRSVEPISLCSVETDEDFENFCKSTQNNNPTDMSIIKSDG